MKTTRQKRFALNLLYDLIRRRKKLSSKAKKYSYTVKLLSLGRRHIGKKIKEEAQEVVHAALKESPRRTIQESADLLYHLLVLWVAKGVKPQEVWQELDRRKGKSGIEEKLKRKKDELRR
jgi:phosphoribosyl-ATP pyrophosphohydrolase